MNKNLEVLEELTKKLTPFSKIIKKETSDYVELEGKDGSIIGFSLFKDHKVLISRFLMTDGASFAKHVHEGIHEFLLIIEGKLDLVFDDKTVTMVEKDHVMVPPGVPHAGIAHGTTWILCVSMPPEPMFVTGDIKVLRKS